MSEYSHSRVYLDPLGMIVMSDGSRRQEIELVLTDDPDRDPPSLTDPVLRLNADHAAASCSSSPSTPSGLTARGRRDDDHATHPTTTAG